MDVNFFKITTHKPLSLGFFPRRIYFLLSDWNVIKLVIY